MISKNNVLFNKIDKKDYFIYIDKNTNRGIFSPYYRGMHNAFFTALLALPVVLALIAFLRLGFLTPIFILTYLLN